MSDTTETEHGVDMKESKPVAWIRYCADGSYEGPIVDSMMEDVRKKSGAWTPLFAKREKALTDELRDERDAEDAARYRWLRSQTKISDSRFYDLPKKISSLNFSPGTGRDYNSKFDACIDNTRKAKT